MINGITFENFKGIRDRVKRDGDHQRMNGDGGHLTCHAIDGDNNQHA